MPLQDTATIIGGYNQVINDWALGDDRILTGQYTGSSSFDPSIATAYFTLKLNPNDIDSNAILQTKITQTPGPNGYISQDPVTNFFNILTFHIFAGNYQVFVTPGTNYWWDVRIITASGTTYTVATGTVQFIQNVTQTNASGIPAPPFTLPNAGIPRFRGFVSTRPDLIVGYNFVDVVGDFYRKLVPQPGNPVGYICVQSGAPGTWVGDGIVGDIGSGA